MTEKLNENITRDQKKDYINKKNRYIINYYRCKGVGCFLDHRKTSMLYSSKPTPQPIKECWECLNLEPKYYNNYCNICLFLKKYNLDKTKVEELLRVFNKKGNSLKYTNNDKEFIKNIATYKILRDQEKEEIEKERTKCVNIFQNKNYINLENLLTNTKKFYDIELSKLKNRVTELENR